eukprot:1656355-Prorocentrum_lima.AAC.1
MLDQSVGRAGRDARAIHIVSSPRAVDTWEGVEETIGHAAPFWGTREVQQAEVVTPIGAPHW